MRSDVKISEVATPGCQVFSVAYGQNPDKNGQNDCFF